MEWKNAVLENKGREKEEGKWEKGGRKGDKGEEETKEKGRKGKGGGGGRRDRNRFFWAALL